MTRCQKKYRTWMNCATANLRDQAHIENMLWLIGRVERRDVTIHFQTPEQWLQSCTEPMSTSNHVTMQGRVSPDRTPQPKGYCCERVPLAPFHCDIRKASGWRREGSRSSGREMTQVPCGLRSKVLVKQDWPVIVSLHNGLQAH